MSTTLISIFAVILYLVAGLLIGLRLANKAKSPYLANKGIPVALGLGAVGLHAFVLYDNIFGIAGINLNFFNTLSLIAWLIALFLLLAALSKPVENLGLAILPLAALALLLDLFVPGQYYANDYEIGMGLHIMLSIIAYSILSIAAAQAVLLAIQDKHLHSKQPGGLIKALPPLQTMETLLFQMIGLGFILQSLSLISGFFFLEDIFAQHLVHKTILSVIAWAVFATLLWGHWRYGWRGKTALRWTLSGFFLLLLAFLGSKLVLEILLDR